MSVNEEPPRLARRKGAGEGGAFAGATSVPSPRPAPPVPAARGGRKVKEVDLEFRLAEIDCLDISALRAGWAELFRRPPPTGISRRLLLYALSHDAQARVYGGLRPSVRRKLLHASKTPKGPGQSTTGRIAQRTLSPGSRIVREWHGRIHSVDVEENGFLYEGRRFRSLSEVARAITGARWSGPRFFGL